MSYIKNYIIIFSIFLTFLFAGISSSIYFNSFKNIESFEKETSSITFSSTLLIKQLLPGMKKNKFGRILNISSIGLRRPITNLAVSNASRAYLAGLMVGVSNEVAEYGITINTIMPGIIWTNRQKQLTKIDAKKNKVV